MQIKNSLTIKGTLIVVVLFQEGYVICADKRANYSTGETRDDMSKLFQMGPSAIASMAGTTILQSKASLSTPFNIPEILKEIASKKPFRPTTEYWWELISFFKTKFDNYLANADFKNWPDTPEGEDKSLFELPFFYVEDGSKLKMSEVIMDYKKQQPPKVEVKLANIETPGLFYGFSANNIVNVLQLDGCEEVNDLREDPIINPFLDKNRLPKQVTLKEALMLGKYLIKVSSEREPTSVHVSSDCDCVILKRIGGVKWPSKEIIDQPKKPMM